MFTYGQITQQTQTLQPQIRDNNIFKDVSTVEHKPEGQLVWNVYVNVCICLVAV